MSKREVVFLWDPWEVRASWSLHQGEYWLDDMQMRYMEEDAGVTGSWAAPDHLGFSEETIQEIEDLAFTRSFDDG